MPLSMYDASAPIFVRMLDHLSNVLDKAVAHAKTAKIDPAELLTARLFPDMWSLAEQVRAACNFPVRATGRLSGLAMPQFDAKDDSFAGLKERIASVIAFVKTADRASIDGTEQKEIVFPTGDTQRVMSGQDYLLKFALPNFYFHLTAAYAILRHKGVPLVKEDYLGSV